MESKDNRMSTINLCTYLTSPTCDKDKPLSKHACTLHKNIQLLKDDKYSKLTIGMFFEFMRTAYQVNDGFEELAAILATKSELDWNKLAKIDLHLEMCNDNKLLVNKNNISTISTNENKTIDDIQNLSLEHKDDTSSSQITSGTVSNFQCNEFPVTLCHSNDTNNMEERNKLDHLKLKKSDLKILRQLPENTTDTIKTKTSSTAEQIKVKEHVLADIMKKNLSDVLHEGLLDSVLPYMLPKPLVSQPIIKKSIINSDVKKNTYIINNVENGVITTLSLLKENDKNKQLKKNPDNEIEIHVCDEGKNIKRDFYCSQQLLIKKMCYFADITAGQKLEEIDISVHCDIIIFDWLMRWVKKDLIKQSEWPVLEATNVIPIMVSASFLQMEPLLDTCMQFCHDNISDILKTSTVLTCLNENLLSRLAELFTNDEVENLKDKKDKIQSRLFCKLIMSLAEINPDNERGHYSSLATLFKCGKCGKNIIQSISDYVPCIPSAMKIDNRGNIHSEHTRDATWSLNDYIMTLRSEIRSWRKVYWRLWCDCHFLFCQQCDMYFPIHQMNWCSYHPELPQFFTNEQQKSTSYPLGRYPCCSQRAYRFESIPNHYGCRYKEHLPNIKTEKDVNILNIFMAHKEIISVDPPQLFFPEKITRLITRDMSIHPGKLMCKETMWWDGLKLVPPKPRFGLLAKIWSGFGTQRLKNATDLQKNAYKICQQTSQTIVSSATSTVVDSDEDDIAVGFDDNSMGEELYDSEVSSIWSIVHPIDETKKKSKNPTFKRESGRCWSTNLIVRYNQDNQRDFEERASMQMIGLLTKRTSTECTLLPKICTKQHIQVGKNNHPMGGTYIKLEAEFRDQWARSYKYKNLFIEKKFNTLKKE